MPKHTTYEGQSQRHKRRNSKHRDPSRILITLLRHHAHNYGASDDGSLSLVQIKKYPGLESINESQIRTIVASCDKQRFAIIEPNNDSGVKELRVLATQGHSFPIKEFDAGMIELRLDMDPEEFPQHVIHGTFSSAIADIQRNGLSRMGRQHIHFTTAVPESGEVISGMRRTCTHIIEIDIASALRDGYRFYQSINGVILTPGDETGHLPSQYISSITER